MGGEQAAQQLFPEKMLFLLHAHTEVLHGGFARPEVTGGKFHYGILQERQMPDDAGIAADGDGGDERVREVHQDAPEVAGHREVRAEFRIGQDDVIACRDVVVCLLKRESHAAFAAKDMDDTPRIAQGVELLPGIGKDDSVEICLSHNLPSVWVAKIIKNHE